jgi:hypothetical protein
MSLGALGLALLMVLAACSIGGSSGKKSNATATTSTTINLEASPSVATSPIAAGSPASRPSAATPATAGQTGAPAATPGATTTGTGATAPGTKPTKAATKAATSNEPPVVTTCSPDSIPPFTGKKADYKVSVDGLNFRAGPGTNCDTLGDPLAVDTPVKVISDPVIRKGEKAKWVEIEVNGQDGWVAEEYIKPAS